MHQRFRATSQMRSGLCRDIPNLQPRINSEDANIVLAVLATFHMRSSCPPVNTKRLWLDFGRRLVPLQNINALIKHDILIEYLHVPGAIASKIIHYLMIDIPNPTVGTGKTGTFIPDRKACIKGSFKWYPIAMGGATI